MTNATNTNELADAVKSVACQLKWLGNGDASYPPFGAIENLAKELKDGLAHVAEAIEHLARAVEDHG